MGSSGGASQSEMYAIQKKAREDAEQEIADKNRKANAAAQAAADAGSQEATGGVGSQDGALSGSKKKKGSTLSGEGESTFSRATSKLGE